MVKLGDFIYPTKDFYTVIGIFDEAIKNEPITRNLHVATNIDIWHETFIYLGKKEHYNFSQFAEAIESLFTLEKAVQVDVATFVTPSVSSLEVAEHIMKRDASEEQTSKKTKNSRQIVLVNYDQELKKKLTEILKRL